MRGAGDPDDDLGSTDHVISIINDQKFIIESMDSLIPPPTTCILGGDKKDLLRENVSPPRMVDAELHTANSVHRKCF